MINMLVADKNKNVMIRPHLLGSQFQVGSQFPVFSAPLVKDQQLMFPGDGKAAMVIMSAKIRMLHADAHLHGPLPIKIESIIKPP